jgi:hypothetical protein
MGLWRKREVARRLDALSKNRIVRAAIEILDSSGEAGFELMRYATGTSYSGCSSRRSPRSAGTRHPVREVATADVGLPEATGVELPAMAVDGVVDAATLVADPPLVGDDEEQVHDFHGSSRPGDCDDASYFHRGRASRLVDRPDVCVRDVSV